MERPLIWPDPVPCRPENPVHGIRTCVARQKNIKCPWLKVDYCGVSTDDMSDALDELGLSDLNWVLEDELDEDDVAEAAIALREALSNALPSATTLPSPFAGSPISYTRYGATAEA